MSKRFLLSLYCLFAFGLSFGQIPTGYYNQAASKTGETLRASLRDIITAGSVKLPYTSSSFDVWDAYAQTDVRPGTNIIWDMYSDIPGGTPLYSYTLYANQCGTAAAEGDCYAREHQVPNSWWGGFDDASNPQYTDLHHLPPADQFVNNKKSAYPIGQISSPVWVSSNGSKVGPCSWPGYTGTVFEPIDEYKGDFARAYLYVATRYMNVLSSWVTNYPNTDSRFVINSTGNNFKQWFIDMLIQWHINDPVSQKEIDRNNAIYYNTPQRNRNPYVDRPEFVCLVWSSTICNAAPSISSITRSPLFPGSTASVSVSALVSPSAGRTISSVMLEWGTNGTLFPNTVNMNLVTGFEYVTAASIPAQPTGTTVYYRIIADDDQNNSTTSSVQQYTVVKAEPSNYPSIFSCSNTTGSSITLSWTDATGAVVPDGYLIKASSASLAAIQDPNDTVPELNSSFVKNVSSGSGQVIFSGLSSGTTYYFKIYPFTNAGSAIDYKTSTGIPSASCSTIVVVGLTCANDLIISEYVEGSSSNKYIEIYNNTGAAVNLSDYKLRLFTNGVASPSSDVALSGTLNDQNTIVYKNGLATAYSGTSITNAVLNFNGDDAVALYKISTDSYVDIFGRIGEQPAGGAWTSGSFTTLNKTLVRNSNVTSGVTVNPVSGFPTLSTEWTQFNEDVVGNLGSHSMTCPVCALPSSSASNVIFSSISSNSVTVSWTNGSGSKRIVVAKEESSVTGIPDEQITYSASSVFGSGSTISPGEFVVYNNTGNSVTVSGLTSGKRYYFTVFEYNCNPGAEIYLTPGTSSSVITYSIIGVLSENQFCVTPTGGASGSIEITSTGSFNSTNIYRAQLSNAAGSFVSPVVIGSVTSNQSSEVINFTIPANTPSGSGYKIRVVSTNPVITGSETSAFEIILSPLAVAPTALSSDRSGFCSSDSGDIVLTASGGSGAELKWYSGSCGEQFLGTGNPLVIPSPVSTTTYYASWVNTCSISSCASVTVTVSGLPAATAGSAISNCNAPASIAMTGASSSGGTNLWSGGEGLGTWTQNANPALAVFTPSVPGGSFEATLTVFSSGGCSNLSASYTRKISWGATGYWTGSVSSDWFVSSNWCGGVPTSSSNIVIPSADHTLFSPSVNSSASCNNINLNGQLSLEASITLNVYGNWTTNGGSLSADPSSIVLFRGAAKTIGGTNSVSFPAVRFNQGSSYTMNNSNQFGALTFLSGTNSCSLAHGSGANLTVDGNVSVFPPNNNGTNSWNLGNASAEVTGNVIIGNASSNSSRIAKINLSNGSLTIGGNLSFSSGSASNSVLDLSGGTSTLNLAGSFTRSTTGTLTPGTQSTFNYNGSAVAQTILTGTGISYFNLHVNNTHPSGATLSGNITSANVTGNLMLQSGMLSNGGFSVSGGASRQFSVANGCTYKLTSATTMPSGFGTVSLGNSSTVEFAGTSGQTIPALNYGNLTSSGSGARTLPSSGTISISGIFIPGTNSFTTTGSTVNFSGSNQDIPAINSASGYNNLSISQTSGDASLSGEIRVGGTLNLSSGRLNLGSYILTIAGSSAVSGAPFSSSKMIVADGGGEIRKLFSSNGSYLFPVGDQTGTADYSPVNIILTSGSYALGAYAAAKVFNAKHPQNSNTNNFLSRYWSVNVSGISNPNYSLTASYVPGDIVGSDNNIFMVRYAGALPWTFFDAANTSSKTLTASSLTNSGAADFSGISANNISVSILGGGVSICSGDSVQLTALPEGTGPFTYSWSPAAGVSNTSIANPKVSPSSSATYTVTLTDSQGSTATATATITVNSKPSAIITTGGSTSICQGNSVTLTASAGASYLWNTGSTAQSINVSAAGPYFVTVTSAAGCSSLSDSVFVSVRNNSTGSESMTICSSGLPILWNGSVISAAGVYQATLANSVGCDSVVTLNLTVLQTANFSNTVNSCNSYNLPWGGVATASGIYSHTYAGAASNGCDSIVTLQVNISSSTFQSNTVSACGSYLWNTVVYTQSGNYIHTYLNGSGCASADTLKLTILNGTFDVTVASACDSYVWNGNTYTASGTYIRNYTNASGCPSADTLKLTISNGTRNSSVVNDCFEYLWSLNGQTYTQSGLYTYSYTNASGCPSYDTLKLTLSGGTTSTVIDSACNTYTWSLNGNTYTQSGNYTHTAGAAAGSGGGVKISQVYGGGGGSTGTYIRDYVELYNSSCSLIDIGNWALEYGAATGNWGSSSGNIFVFPPGTVILPKRYLLIQCGAAGTAGTALPVTPDFSTATTGFSMSVNNGKVALFREINSNKACDSIIAGSLVDKVSYGTANCAEGTATAALSATTVLVRKNGGETDSGNNASDFSISQAAGITLRNSSSQANTFNPCPACTRTILQLKITPSATITDSVSACESYRWSMNNTTYTESGVYNFVSGCTTQILKLDIRAGTRNAVSVNACESYSWNGVNYTQSGTHTFSYLNASGCPSVDTLRLSLSSLPEAGSISGVNSICTGDTVLFSSTGNAGGLWLSSDTSVFRVNETGRVTAVGVGSAFLRYIVASAFCDSDTAIKQLTVNNCNTTLNIKLFLQGYYEGSGLMRPSLMNSGISGATSIQADTVWLQIRNALNGALVAGPLPTILHVDGTASVIFPAISGSHYIVINHRNTLETWSAVPVLMGPQVSYDFSNAASKAFGANQVMVDTGVYAIWSGDVNQDGSIESSDYSLMENDILSILFGYYSTDITGDGAVESDDYSLIEINILKILFAAVPFP